MRTGMKLRRFLAADSCLALLAANAAAQEATGEYLVKAAFLYNFAKFVDGPPVPSRVRRTPSPFACWDETRSETYWMNWSGKILPPAQFRRPPVDGFHGGWWLPYSVYRRIGTETGEDHTVSDHHRTSFS